MKHLLTSLLCISFAMAVFAQEAGNQSFQIQVSSDSILLGNYFEVRFIAHNLQGDFEPPDFKDFDVIGGPNQMSSMSMINGKTTQSVSYSYFLKPKSSGVFYIGPAYFGEKNQLKETSPIEISCLPNPEGIVEESRITDSDQKFEFGRFPPFGDDLGKKKKKLKVTKI